MLRKGKDSIFIRTGRKEFDNLFPLVRSFLEKDVLDVEIDAKKIRGYRAPDAKSIWIRDYSDMLRGIKYIEKDLFSTVEHFAETQAANGRIFDYFTTFPEKLPCEKENWTKYVRVPVEADVEFRFVKAAYLAWQASGDDNWIKRQMPAMERALLYILQSPWRWDNLYGLVKRAYTIDTWDFAYTAGSHEWLQFQIDDRTFWGIMHGDNSGYYEAFKIMACLYAKFQSEKAAAAWNSRAARLKRNLNRICWNGKYYTHFVKLNPVQIPGVDETTQLSLSNPMNINRGAANHEMAVDIIKEYQGRRRTAKSFAEWFSIDPPFPSGVFGDAKLKKGAYINGGIMPLVGGELAKAAFDHGYETYGVDILVRYSQLISRTNQSFLWYFPTGKAPSRETSTSPEASSTDGWGSSAMLYAFIEGLAGIEDQSKLFQKVKISPRWPAAEVQEAEVRIEYDNSGAYVHYIYNYTPEKIFLELSSPHTQASFHVLLPQKSEVKSVDRDGKPLDFREVKIEESHYVDFSISVIKKCGINICFSRK